MQEINLNFRSKIVSYNISSKNRMEIEKTAHGFKLKYSTSKGTGSALIFNSKTSQIAGFLNLGNSEMFLVGIDTVPSNAGIGRVFLKDIFDFFNIETLYLASDGNHPVWNKIAIKVHENLLNDTIIFKINKNEI